ncbi:nucleotidyl transferase AbiEii/AbiGii toxin family protein [Candidatus Margulisiibacteriota bacterium]
MISKELISNLATKLQTSEENIAREYLQHLFLSIFYKDPMAQKILFKGGTALRLIYNSPRYSEDLDFTGFGLTLKAVEDLVIKTLEEFERMDIATKILESKKTTGGYSGKFGFSFQYYDLTIKIEISQRKSTPLTAESTLIENNFMPAYLLFQMPEEALISEKIAALLNRGKPRDYFDFYFLLRANLLSSKNKNKLALIKKKLHENNMDFKKELERFLPKSHQPIIKQLKKNIIKEVKRYI